MFLFAAPPSPAQDNGGKAAAAPDQPQQPQPPKDSVEGVVWGALVHMTDKAADPPNPETFKAMEERLKKAYEGKEFSLLGEHTQNVFKAYETWVVPSKEVFLRVDSKGPAEGGGLKLNVQLWRGEKVLVKTDADLKPNSPLVLAGPKWRGGRLLFVLMLTGEKAVE